jgi:ubiquinone/menaquinone biosynthesis C-methylase UbiE
MMEVKKTILFDIDKIIDKMAIEERQRVAELGCGNFGFFTFPLAKLVGKNGIVYAVDIIKSFLEEIKNRAKEQNLPQIQTIWSNLEVFKGAKIESSSLDRAFLINVLHQSDKRAEIIREAYRLLKTKGKLMIVEWSATDSPLGPPPERRLKLESLKAATLKLGFDIEDEFLAGPYHYGLMLTKL